MNMKLLAGTLAVSALLMSCTTDSGGATEGVGLSVKGRVMATNSSPVSGVVVALARNGAKDTTDAQGRYELHALAAQQGAAAHDTVVYTRNGQPLARVSVATWIDTLPDVQVVQRDFSGLLTGGAAGITRVEGVVTGDGIDSTDPVTSEFYYNSLTGNYSGFVYFPAPTSVQNYQVRIRIYGAGNVLAGQSQVVPFNSTAGNITVPAFSPGNALPVAKAGNDTAVAPSATIHLHGAAVDSLGTIVKWEWSIGGSAFATSSGDTTFSRATEGAYPCILRVTDNDGNTAVDTVVVAVLSKGVTWTARTSGTTAGLSSVVWTGTQFVAVGSSSTVLTSPDGITWTQRALGSSTPANLTSVAWSGQTLVAISTSLTGNAFSSSDGISWSPLSLPLAIGSTSGSVVSSADSVLLIGSNSGTARFIGRSVDHGLTWNLDTVPKSSSKLPQSVQAFARHNGRLVAMGSNGFAVSSVNGGTWTTLSTETTWPRPYGGIIDYTITSIVSTGTYAVGVGLAGHVTRSADGITWQQPRNVARIPEDAPTEATIGDLYSVTFTGTSLVAVGAGNHVVSADGGANWAPVQTGATTLSSVAWNGIRLVAVGNGGAIVTSP